CFVVSSGVGRSLLSSLTVGVLVSGGFLGGGTTFAIGPQVLYGGLLALAWGAVGGWVGGRLAGASPQVQPAMPASETMAPMGTPPLRQAPVPPGPPPTAPPENGSFGFGP